MTTDTAQAAVKILAKINGVKKDMEALDKMDPPSEIHFRKSNTFAHYPTYAFTVEDEGFVRKITNLTKEHLKWKLIHLEMELQSL